MPMKDPPHPGFSIRHDCLEPLGMSVADGARAATHTASVTLPDGQYQLKYNAHDRAGNVSATGTFAFTIDATVPLGAGPPGASPNRLSTLRT